MAETFACKTQVRTVSCCWIISKRFLDAQEFLPKDILVSAGVRQRAALLLYPSTRQTFVNQVVSAEHQDQNNAYRLYRF